MQIQMIELERLDALFPKWDIHIYVWKFWPQPLCCTDWASSALAELSENPVAFQTTF